MREISYLSLNPWCRLLTIVWVGACGAISGCGTYRVGTGEYRGGSKTYSGMGDYKNPSDFPASNESKAPREVAPDKDSEEEEAKSKSDSESESEFDEGAAIDTEEVLRNARSRIHGSNHYVPRRSFKLSWPVAKVRVNRGFRASKYPKHEGVDLGGKRGSTITAAHEGVVIYVGRDFRGYGNMILIEFNNEWATLYGHLDKFTIKEGRYVQPGDPIGTMGATGRATGVHLHFEVIYKHEPVDPLSLL